MLERFFDNVGFMGDFVKYYDGAFCEAGNLGRESIIMKDCQPNILKTNEFSLLCNHNGSLVERFKARLVKK